MTDPKKIDDGGQAFPVSGFTDDPGNPMRTEQTVYGMTLRDYFAAQVSSEVVTKHLNGKYVYNRQSAVKEIYEIADAMLVERSKTNTEVSNG